MKCIAFFFLLAAVAAAVASKEKSWTLSNAAAQRKKQNKQMPARPRSVNSTFEKRGKPPLGYATLNDRSSNRSFQETSTYGRYAYICHRSLYFCVYSITCKGWTTKPWTL